MEKEEHYYKADHEKLKKLGFKATRLIDEEISIMLDDLMVHKDRIKAKEEAIRQMIKWKGGNGVRQTISNPLLMPHN